MTNLQKQTLSQLALSGLQSLNELVGVQVHFDTMTVGNPSQFLNSYKLIANGSTQSILYNGTSDNIAIYAGISGVLTGNSQAELVSGDIQTLQGTINDTSVVQNISTQTFSSLPNYQQINLKPGYGVKLTLYDLVGEGDYIDIDVSMYKNPKITPKIVPPTLSNDEHVPIKNTEYFSREYTGSETMGFSIVVILVLLLTLGCVGYYFMKKRN